MRRRGLLTGAAALAAYAALPTGAAAQMLLRGVGDGNVGFLPPPATNQSLWLAASSFSAVGDGGTIAGNWPDLSGNSNTGTLSGSPVYRASVVNGLPGVEFISGRKFVTPAFLGSAWNTAFGFYAVLAQSSQVFKVFAGAGSGKYYGATPAVASNHLFYSNTSSLSNTIQYVDQQNSGSTAAWSSPMLYAFRYDGSNKYSEVWFGTGGYQYATTTATTGNLGFSSTALTVGDYDGGGFTWNGQICEVLLYKDGSSTSWNLVTNYLRAKYGLNWAAGPQVYCDGNSMTAGYPLSGASGPTTTYPAQLSPLLGSAWTVVNVGHPGDTTTQLAGFDLGILDPYWGSNRSKNIAVCWEITNDLVINQSAASAYSNVQSWCAGRRSAGFKVVVGTCLPRLGASGCYAGFETDRQSVNTNIRANWASFADALMDVGNDATIGQVGQNSNATYYNSDLVHPTDAGYAIVAGYAKTAVLSL